MTTSMHSPTIAALLPALAAAIADMADPVKNAANPHFKNRYADLGEVIDCSEAALAKHKLLVTETLETADGGVQVLRTRVWHIPSGEWLDSVVRLMIGKMEMQPLGSAITYARRYARKALFGMVDVDDDGKKASSRSKAKEEVPAVRPFDLVEEALAALDDVGSQADLKAWVERMRASGFQGDDKAQAIRGYEAKTLELKGGR